MNCLNCDSDQVNVQVINEQKLVNKRHGIFWWLFVGWWWIFVKWIFFTLPAFIFAVFVGKRKQIKNIQKTVAICQNCGNTWNINNKK